ncbi:GTA-gp10 family protein [Hyphobacterium sp.]|uniref:GTA-gp10 family protein n=1 Tax=Hyphobacterium sp. TaxID=2004662 RepID=UPI003BABB773
MTMNRARGEVPLIIDGEERTLCLTLGALAEIETALACSGFTEMGERMKNLSAGDLVRVVQALLAGGEGVKLDLATARIDPAAAVKAVADCFDCGL